jgi:hypothetical protein
MEELYTLHGILRELCPNDIFEETFSVEKSTRSKVTGNLVPKIDGIHKEVSESSRNKMQRGGTRRVSANGRLLSNSMEKR